MSIGRNTAYNLAGFAVPTVLGLATVPAYLALIGPARYGVLALVWLILGYFGLFDLGLGRATSQKIATLRDASPEERRRAMGTALVSNLGIGCFGSALLVPVAWYMFGHSVDLDPALRAETMRALPLLSLALPIATTQGLLNGALMGRERFRETNAIAIVSTSLFQLLPLGVTWWFGPDLLWLMVASIGARLSGVVMFWLACRREFGAFGLRHWDPSQLRELLAFGGWVTLASLFGPILVMSDRFMIGSMLGAVAVTVYTVPGDAMRRISGVAVALATALFPRLAVASDEETQNLSRGAVGAYFALLTPAVAGGLFVMDPVMRLWLGDQTGSQAAPLARILLVTVWISCFAQVPYTQLQAQGRPDLVGKNLLVQTPFYLAALWFALSHYGLPGAAWVLLLRTLGDTVALFSLANRSFSHATKLLATLGLFCIGAVWLNARAPLGWQSGLAAGLVAALAFAGPAWAAAPREVTEFIRTRPRAFARGRR